MSCQSRHVDMLESDISGKCGRTFISIGRDTVNKQYTLLALECITGHNTLPLEQFILIVKQSLSFSNGYPK